MTAQEILNTINTGDYEFYGIRADRPGIQPGDQFDNSHQWYQDDPSEWGEECEYNADLGFWDGGELNGTCTIGIRGYLPTVEDVQRALNLVRKYCGENLYLVGGYACEAGNDIGESIIRNAECVAII